MIEPKEIKKVAAANRVNDRQIEKDYVLSWVLFAISKNEILNKALVFKGGTVLKKAYFENYRFSEDLDFTLIDDTSATCSGYSGNSVLTNEQIKAEFDNLFDFIKEEANIDMRIDEKKWKIHETGSLQFYIDYVASLQGNMGSRDLKIFFRKNSPYGLPGTGTFTLTSTRRLRLRLSSVSFGTAG